MCGWYIGRESRLGISSCLFVVILSLSSIHKRIGRGVVQQDVIRLVCLEGLSRGRCYERILNHLLLFCCSLSFLACTVDLVHSSNVFSEFCLELNHLL
jgi:hypothetical protein